LKLIRIFGESRSSVKAKTVMFKNKIV